MTNRHRNRRRNRLRERPPTTNILPAHNIQQVLEPQSDGARLLSKPDDFKQAFWRHVETIGNEIPRNVEIIRENGLECKRVGEWLELKCLGDKVFMSSPGGELFLYDRCSRKVLWSIIKDNNPVHVSYESSENTRSYKLIRGVLKDRECHAHECHAKEFVTKPSYYLDGEVHESKRVAKTYVNLETGRCLHTLTSYGVQKLKEATKDSSILCITRYDFVIICYKPGTTIVLSYRRIATFDISIVSWRGVMLHEKNDAPARMGQTLIKPGAYRNITWSGKVPGKNGEDTLVGEHNLDIGVICIEKGQSDDDVVKREVSKVRDACNGNPNLLRVYDVVSNHDLYKVSMEHCGRSLREFMSSPCKDHNILKLISGIVTGIEHLHNKKIFLGNLDLDNIYVDEDYNAKISVITTKTKFPLISPSGATDDMLALGHAIFFCFTGFEYKGEHLIKPKPSSDYLKPIYDCPDALDLLKKLLDKCPSQRATALQASKHTLFWSPSQNLRFIRAVTERLELKETKFLATINKISVAVFGKTWENCLPRGFLDVMEQGSYGALLRDGSYNRHIYHYDKVYDLLCIIRNLETHEMKIRDQLSKRKPLEPETREMFGMEGFAESYFRKKFPNLVNEVYNVMKKHLGNEPKFREYY